jgi:hypothetical protein
VRCLVVGRHLELCERGTVARPAVRDDARRAARERAGGEDVSDRAGKRVQVFTIAGKFVQQVFIGRECKAPSCGNGSTAASTAFSTDADQKFLYVGNRSQAKVMVLDRKTLSVLDEFGKWGSAPGDFGTLHHMNADSKGNLYVTEVTPLKPENRRVQKFVFVGMSEAALYMTMGFPQKTNDALVGTTQLIYHTMYVYLRDKKVAEVQSHE